MPSGANARREPPAVVGLLLGDKRWVPSSLPTALRLGLRMLTQGTPAWGTLVGEDARALFTGVAAHVISRMPSMAVRTSGGAASPISGAARARSTLRLVRERCPEPKQRRQHP